MRTVILCALLVTVSVVSFAQMEHGRVIQHAEIRMLRIQGKSVVEIHAELVQIHGGHALSISTVRRWYHKFQQGVADFSVKKTGGHVTKVTPAKLQQIQNILAQDNTTCICMIAQQTSLSLRTIHHTLRNRLQLKKRPAKWIPHLLNQAQKTRRMRMAQDLLQRFQCAPTLQSRVITGDESWFSCYEPLMRRSSSSWLRRNQRHPHKPVRDCYVRKVMLVVFWDAQGVVHREFVLNGRGVNTDYYLEVMRTLRQQIRWRRTARWRRNSFWIHHDGAPAHRADPVVQFLQQTRTHILPHPPYSPDLAPSDFFLFACMKKNLRGVTFANIGELQRRVDQELGLITAAEFNHAMTVSWTNRLRKCVAAQGNYFES